jgi:hypothetical protein
MMEPVGNGCVGRDVLELENQTWYLCGSWCGHPWDLIPVPWELGSQILAAVPFSDSEKGHMALVSKLKCLL